MPMSETRTIEPTDPFQIGDRVRLHGFGYEGLEGTILGGCMWRSHAYQNGVPLPSRPVPAYTVDVDGTPSGPFTTVDLVKI